MKDHNNKQTLSLTQSQITLVEQTLLENSSEIITQAMWEQLQSQLKMSKLSFLRRTTVSNVGFKIGYSLSEYVWGTHSTKSLVQFNCVHCGRLYVIRAYRMFVYRKHHVAACVECYRKHHLYDDEWRAKNSAAQLIAQNRPEVLEKHRENSRLLWVGEHGKIMRAAQQLCVSDPVYKENMARIMREKWESDPDYRDRVSGRGVFKHTGSFNEIIYHSKLELAFLLWCVDNNINVKRFKEAIKYIDPLDGVLRDYYPDFILVDEQVIVEVKGQRWIDVSPQVYYAKIEALRLYCFERRISFRVVLDKDMKHYSKRANAYHEAQKQINSIL